MKQLLELALVASALMAVPFVASGQTKIPVIFESTVQDGDQVGLQLSFEIKEAIRGSFGFRLSEDFEKWPHIKMVFVSVDGGQGSTAASMAFLYDGVEVSSPGLYITSSAQACGSTRVQQCARTAMAHLDSAVSRLTRAHPQFAKTLK
jgi:hypothetical protein